MTVVHLAPRFAPLSIVRTLPFPLVCDRRTSFEMAASTSSAMAAPMWHSEGPVTVRHTEIGFGGAPADSQEADATGVPIYHTTPFMRRFNPYEFNGGTTVAVAGDDFVIVAGDTRMSSGYEILSRHQSKLHALTPRCVLAAAGCQTDVTELSRQIDGKVAHYRHHNEQDMSTPAAAQMLGNMLYSRRFFPFYAFCMIAGLDHEGRGAVYGYDAVGSFKRDDYGCMGSGQNYIMPLLDNLVGRKNRADALVALTQAEALAIVKEAFVTAGERDIYTGDSVEIIAINAAGVTKEVLQLKKD